MQTKGLNLGDNQTTLLQKVEELTLYLIEKDKQLNVQQEQIAAQTSFNQTLQKEIESQATANQLPKKSSMS